MPEPWTNTRVFAVPRSMARSRRLMARARPARPRASRAGDPAGLARLQVLLLPDRCVALDLFDAEPGRLERLGAMWRGAAHHHGDLPDLELAHPMREHRATDRPAVEHLLPDALQRGLRPLLPRLVVQAGHPFGTRMIAH